MPRIDVVINPAGGWLVKVRAMGSALQQDPYPTADEANTAAINEASRFTNGRGVGRVTLNLWFDSNGKLA